MPTIAPSQVELTREDWALILYTLDIAKDSPLSPLSDKGNNRLAFIVKSIGEQLFPE